ncbi:MAG: fumarylacetoacetate hydrolase family protein [Kluyvera ascorbata]
MKLCRYGEVGKEKPGLVDNNGNIRDLSFLMGDIDHQTLDRKCLDAIRQLDPENLELIDKSVRIGAPIATPSKFIAIGLNYRDHAQEAGMPIPQEPVVFFKSPGSICGPHDDIFIPPHSSQLDWEAELGIIIGKQAKFIPQEQAFDYIAGYCVVNDISERTFQFQSSQWDKGKSFDTFGPLGPYLVTADEITDPQNLRIWLEVNGQVRQDSHTRQMIFPVAEIVAYLSRYMTLNPGDIIATGTPPGVAMGMKPAPVWLKEGDVLSTHIEGIGELKQRLVKYPG